MKVKEFSLKYNTTDIDAKIIKNSNDTTEILRQVFDKDEINIYECFYILLLNHSLKVQGYAKIRRGTFSNNCRRTTNRQVCD